VNNLATVRIFLAALSGWLNHQQQDVIAHLIEEDRTLRTQLAGRRLRLTDAQRCRLAQRGKRRLMSTAARKKRGTGRLLLLGAAYTRGISGLQARPRPAAHERAYSISRPGHRSARGGRQGFPRPRR
jgi:hypothetical protein